MVRESRLLVHSMQAVSRTLETCVDLDSTLHVIEAFRENRISNLLF